MRKKAKVKNEGENGWRKKREREKVEDEEKRECRRRVKDKKK